MDTNSLRPFFVYLRIMYAIRGYYGGPGPRDREGRRDPRRLAGRAAPAIRAFAIAGRDRVQRRRPGVDRQRVAQPPVRVEGREGGEVRRVLEGGERARP